MKLNENKRKQNCFLFLTFIFSNPDFSMGYSRFKQKFFFPSQPLLQMSRATRLPTRHPLLSAPGLPSDPANGKHITQTSVFAKKLNPPVGCSRRTTAQAIQWLPRRFSTARIGLQPLPPFT
jgi:hypothetical protein